MLDESCLGPLVKTFEFGDAYFVYDVNTNQIVEVERAVYDVIDRWRGGESLIDKKAIGSDYTEGEIDKAVETIKGAIDEHGLFSSHRPKRLSMGIYSGEDVKRLYEGGFPQMVLELTMECNLSCRYCQVSGHYSKPGTHSLHMSREMMFKAIDFYYEKSKGSEYSHISFYGGEPLLKFDLIKEAVGYVRAKSDGSKYTFSFTTNGMLFNKEMIDFFINHDFRLLVSLDGPKSTHDRYRVFQDGGGTFDTIIKNLEFIREYNRDYFDRNVSVTCVVAPPFDNLDDLFDFFSSNPLFKDKRERGKVRASFVDSRETDFLKDIGLDKASLSSNGIADHFTERFKRSLLERNYHFMSIEKGFVFPIIYSLARRKIRKVGDYIAPNGACQLGGRRFFVRTNGDIEVCEKGGSDYKLGNVEKGFDYELMASYYRKMEERMQDCVNCWAMHYCSRCWVQVGDLDEFDGEVKTRFCETNKAIVLKAFKVYVDLLQKDSDCLKVFKEISVS